MGQTLNTTTGIIYPVDSITKGIAGSGASASTSVGAGAPHTDEQVLATIQVPAGVMGPNGYLIVRSAWTMTGSTNAKTLRTRHAASAPTAGGTSLLSIAITTNTVVTYAHEQIVQNRNSVSSQVCGRESTNDGLGIATTSLATGTVNTAAASVIEITGQKATGTETLTLESYSVEVVYRP